MIQYTQQVQTQKYYLSTLLTEGRRLLSDRLTEGLCPGDTNSMTRQRRRKVAFQEYYLQETPMQEKFSREQNALLRLTLPLPPSINEQYATVNGHRVSSAVARRFKQQVRSVLRTLERQGILHEDLCHSLRQNYLALFLDFYFSTPLKRDLDGGLKITQDALCEGLGLNDNRVVDIRLLKHIDPLHPHLDVELEAIPEWQFDKEYIVLS